MTTGDPVFKALSPGVIIKEESCLSSALKRPPHTTSTKNTVDTDAGMDTQCSLRQTNHKEMSNQPTTNQGTTDQLHSLKKSSVAKAGWTLWL